MDQFTRYLRGMLRCSVGASALIVALAVAAPLALAGARISGSPETLTVDAQDSSIEELLVALGRQFKIHYRSSINLDQRITGTFQGPLRRVVARILDRYNFVVASSGAGMEVTIFGTQNAPASNGAPPPVQLAGPMPEATPNLPSAAPALPSMLNEAADNATAPAQMAGPILRATPDLDSPKAGTTTEEQTRLTEFSNIKRPPEVLVPLSPAVTNPAPPPAFPGAGSGD